MGNSPSKPPIAPTAEAHEVGGPTTEESTRIEDLMDSGRYKIAKPETVEMLKQIQGPRQANVMYPDTEVRDIRQYIAEQEGLEIGQARKRILAQQWRFFLSCEPIQRGLDAGLIFGSVTAAIQAWRSPKNRVPGIIALSWLGGFCTGVVTVPVLVLFADNLNAKRIKEKEKELFRRQREEFYGKTKE